MIFPVVLVSMVVLGLGYMLYSRFVGKVLQVDDFRATPACQINAGVAVPGSPANIHLSAVPAGPVWNLNNLLSICGPFASGAGRQGELRLRLRLKLSLGSYRLSLRRSLRQSLERN